MKRFILSLRRLPVAPLCLTFLGATLWPEMELLVPSLPAMKLHFGVSEGQIQQLLSINFIGFICGVIFAGPLCDSWGRKKMCVAGSLVFLLASVGAALSDNFALLMSMRFLQGLAVTAPIIGGGGMLLEITKGPGQIFWMSVSSAAITLRMAGAPLIGAWINAHFGFRGNLWAIFISALVGIIPIIFLVEETLAVKQRSIFNIKAIAKSYGALLKNGRFMALTTVMSGLPAAYWVYTGVSSLYLVDYLGLEPALFGSYQGPIVGTFALLSIVISQIHRRVGLKTCLITGFILMLIGAGALLGLAISGIENAILTTLFMMFFVGGMVPINSLLYPSALNALPPELLGSAQSLIQAMRLVIASIGTGILGIVYQGPFLPVALIIAVMFFLCWLLLWSQRSNLNSTTQGTFVAGH